MTTLKYTLATLISLISLSSFAGGGGGGGVMMDALIEQPSEIVFHMSEEDGVIKFAYGHLVDNKWQVEKIELPSSELHGDLGVIRALNQSKTVKKWAPIQ